MNSINKAIEKYSDSLPVKLLIQQIPFVGGILDTVLSETASKWRQERIDQLLEIFGDQIKSLIDENANLQSQIENKVGNEEFYDLFISCMQKTILTGARDKIKLFANILCNYCILGDSQDDAELIINVINDLSIKEMQVISKIKDNGNSIEFDRIDNVFIEFEKAKLDCQNKKMINFDVNSVLSEYKVDDNTLFLFDRLERQFILKKYESSRRNLSYSFATQSQSSQSNFDSEKNIRYIISEFGLKIIQWMFLNTDKS